MGSFNIWIQKVIKIYPDFRHTGWVLILLNNFESFILMSYPIYNTVTQQNIFCPGSFDWKSIGGSHGSLRPELAILEKIFSLPKIIFFLVSLFMAKDVQELMCISFCNICKKPGDWNYFINYNLTCDLKLFIVKCWFLFLNIIYP